MTMPRVLIQSPIVPNIHTMIDTTPLPPRQTGLQPAPRATVRTPTDVAPPPVGNLPEAATGVDEEAPPDGLQRMSLVQDFGEQPASQVPTLKEDIISYRLDCLSDEVERLRLLLKNLQNVFEDSTIERVKNLRTDLMTKAGNTERRLGGEIAALKTRIDNEHLDLQQRTHDKFVSMESHVTHRVQKVLDDMHKRFLADVEAQVAAALQTFQEELKVYAAANQERFNQIIQMLLDGRGQATV
ncbi:hypothetical protein DICSQDRAFT_130093 [Dichomitus squalens LYAD-421 SS1]|uniref:Uncharacterized protein n=2 Tax=Dichomitus squalens TaxID=114155 RepID=A0A4Q9M659_9APHY|nr:uncharacterized protein DICSQDRAFT_130093 [Dichomitus squalens LYAD-421 SS1]EJF56427.1 hypothetical protein DICSQDRAFT_130093 [Dichomitus squalens LYAD-421 SS1]TBU21101.1 hypothetical protein BD311DRAFT_679364 [Dichomitus squalens]TBU53037.1 hypothetical protein BD310DRAFT_182292 [Dichomitus squalens]